MKPNSITLITGLLLVVIFGAMLFTFQVRQTEIDVVTTFGKYSRSIDQPGLQFRAPWPIQRVYEFDNRIQNFERKYEQTTTRDALNVIISVYVGWRIVDPRLFLERFNGDIANAELTLEPLVRNAKTGVIGKHPFSDLISTNLADIKFDQIEKEMLAAIQPPARTNYGVEVELLGIKQIGLPESITAKVFERMRAERMRLVKKYQSDGEKEAAIIRANANSETNRVLTFAAAEATKIRGEAEKEAARSYDIFAQSPDLAIFLFQLKTLEQSLKERATLLLDERTPPFNMLNGQVVGPSTSK